MPISIPGAIANNTSTTALINASTNDTYASSLSYNADSDWWRINMVAGLTYDFTLTGDGSATSLDNGVLELLSSTGTSLTGVTGNSLRQAYTATSTGAFYLQVKDGSQFDNLAEGSYIVSARTSDSVVNNSGTTAAITATGSTAGALDANTDSDWYRVDLVAGRTYDFRVAGTGAVNSLDAASLVIRDGSGTLIDSDTEDDWVSITPTTSGTFFVEVVDRSFFDYQAEGNFLLSSRLSDTVVNNQSTTAVIAGSGTTSGKLGQSLDSDWYRVTLSEGLSYGFTLTGDGSSDSLRNGVIAIRNGSNVVLDDAGENGTVTLTPTASGTYWIEVRDGSSFNYLDEGNFRIQSLMSDTIRNDVETTGRVISADRVSGRIDASLDSDWYKMGVVAGRTYTVTLTGDGSATSLEDRYVAAHDQNGTRLTWDYGYGAGDVATVTFTAATTGSVFLAAWGAGAADTGAFRLAVVSDAATVTGTAGSDYRAGGSNGNTMFGLGGNDSLYGNDGNDLLIGDVGADYLAGGNGNDSLRGDGGADILVGGAGKDTAVYTGTVGTTVNLSLTGPQVTGHGSDRLLGIENVTSGGGNDRLTGDALNNILSGGSGTDTLSGGGGIDRLAGAAGNDVLVGGSGGDFFDFARGGDADRVADFANNADTLLLRGLGVTTAAQALARATEVGGNVVFDFGLGDTLTVLNITKAALADDILIG